MDSRRIEAFRVLGIPADSDRDSVAHAFRQLARATHPDVSADPDAADRFASLTAAYRLVSAPQEAIPAPAAVDRYARRREDAAAGTAPRGEGLLWGWSAPTGPSLLRPRHHRAPIVAGPVRVSPIPSAAAKEVGGG